MKNIGKKIDGGVCAAKGFLAGSVHAGIKRVASSKEDLALVFSEAPCSAAGVFTTNRVVAAPVILSQKNLRSASHCGVLLNSGNANACTGPQGLLDAKESAKEAAKALNISTKELFLCSTGRIGVPMPMEKVLAGIARLPASLSRKGSRAAAVAIMTSDTFPKESAVRFSLDKGSACLGGMTKGAGMIHPNMATMLAVLTTDVKMEKKLLQSILADVVERTFNRITVDGDTSTNDTVLLLANGLSGVSVTASDRHAVEVFTNALERVCSDLARMIVRDGEGTSKIVEVLLRGARNPAQAKRAAEAVGKSVLLKCAWAGGDPNWGRIMDALGYSGAVFNPERVDIFYNQLAVVKNGCAGPADPAKVLEIAARPEFTISIDLKAGKAGHHILSSDLTEEYVRLNLSE